MTSETPVNVRVAHPVAYLGTFHLPGMRFEVHRHVGGDLAVYVAQAASFQMHRLGTVDRDGTPDFTRVQIGSYTLFDPAWPLADLVVARALQIGALSA
jgi:hypothetical protein